MFLKIKYNLNKEYEIVFLNPITKKIKTYLARGGDIKRFASLFNPVIVESIKIPQTDENTPPIDDFILPIKADILRINKQKAYLAKHAIFIKVQNTKHKNIARHEYAKVHGTIPKNKVIWHIDGNKNNNNINNLIALTKNETYNYINLNKRNNLNLGNK